MISFKSQIRRVSCIPCTTPQRGAYRIGAPKENLYNERKEKKKTQQKCDFKEVEIWTSRVMFYRSMLNCVNALEGHIPPAESAALMVAEEKPHPDSCKA